MPVLEKAKKALIILNGGLYADTGLRSSDCAYDSRCSREASKDMEYRIVKRTRS